MANHDQVPQSVPPASWTFVGASAGAAERLVAQLEQESERIIRAAADRVPSDVPLTKILTPEPIRAAPMDRIRDVNHERVIGRPVKDVLGLRFNKPTILSERSWSGVRALNQFVEVNAEGDLPARATADSSLPTMRTAACCSCSLRPSSRARRRP